MKYCVEFGSWKVDEYEVFEGTLEECEKWYDDHEGDLGMDEWYVIKEKG